jgi:3',5'-cyclic AMP phosphodiesterase CpdA
MDRRNFIKVSGTAAALGLTASSVPGMAAVPGTVSQEKKTPAVSHAFTFNKGRFKILQITDTHFMIGDERCKDVRKNLEELIRTESPDLIIHTGDVMNAGDRNRTDGEEAMRIVLGWISAFKIPFAVALGNHDGQYELNRSEIFKVVKSIPHDVNQGVEGIYGDSNDVFTLSAPGEGKPQWVFYLFDSGDTTDLNVVEGREYDYVHHDQIGWYRDCSSYFARLNGGKPVPSIAFQHIPTPEFGYVLRDKLRIIKGNIGEEPCTPAINSGLMANFKEMRDVKAIVCGHDHDDDYAAKWKEIFLIYGRFSGGDTVYNDLKPCGARVFEFTEGSDSFRSWIRLVGGEKIQDLRFPEDFNW